MIYIARVAVNLLFYVGCSTEEYVAVVDLFVKDSTEVRYFSCGVIVFALFIPISYTFMIYER